MLNIQKIQPDFPAYAFTVLVLLLVIVRYGKAAIDWLLMQLHQFFIQRYIF